MIRSRRLLASALLVTLLLTTGCLGAVLGDGPLEFSASAAKVDQSATAQTTYEHVESTRQNQSREFSVAGQTREVVVSNYVATYARSADVAGVGERNVGQFVVVSTPQVEVGGRAFNPVGDMSTADLLARMQGQYDGLSDLHPAGNRTVSMLGTETTVSTFEGRATTAAGREVDVVVHLTKVEDDDDFVVAVAVYPKDTGDPDRVDTMIEGVEH